MKLPIRRLFSVAVALVLFLLLFNARVCLGTCRP